ncbi:MAG: chemotaxis protein CheW [Alphaproteobacteria bacterium]
MGQYLTFSLGGRLCGIPALSAQDVLRGQLAVTRVPGAAPEVAGIMNLRGRIVTAVCLRRKFGLPGGQGMAIVVGHGGELYSLMVDAVHEVLSLDDARREEPPATLEPLWRDAVKSVARLDDGLLAILDATAMIGELHGNGKTHENMPDSR